MTNQDFVCIAFALVFVAQLVSVWFMDKLATGIKGTQDGFCLYANASGEQMAHLTAIAEIHNERIKQLEESFGVRRFETEKDK